MSNHSKGMSYEYLVETVYQAILETENRDGRISPIKLERRKIIISNSGTPAEIDIYWEYTVAGITHAVAIECKNLNRNVDITSVRDFARKIEKISGLKGLMVARKGFSKNAIFEARSDNIDLLIIREHSDADFAGHIKTVDVRLNLILPCRTTGLFPQINKEWAVAEGFKSGDRIKANVRNDLLVFEDKSDGFRYTLHDLEQNGFFEKKQAGQHQWRHEFKDGWMYADSETYKLDAVTVEYLKPETIESGFILDFEEYVLAVMEYVSGKKDRYLVLKTGERKEF